MNNLKEVNEQIEASKEILATFPRNNAKNIKACIAQIQDYQKKFIEVKETLIQEMEKRIGKLEEIIQNENISVNKIKDTMKQVVPTYKEPEEINLKVEKHEIENKSSLEIIKDTIEKINNTESKNIKATV